MSDGPRSVLSPEVLGASIAIYTAVALVAFEGLAVVAALPQLTGDLGRVELLPWVITGYLLTSGVATVIAGPLVDAIGTRTMFRWAVTVFTVSGVLCGLTTSMPVLVAARLLQGAGGGLIIAVGLAAVSLVYPDHLIGRAFAANSTVWGVMGVAGPAWAAFLLTVLDWRWIFLVNLPLGLGSLAAGWRALPEPVPDAEPSRLDVPGTLLLALLNTAALVAVDRIGLWSIPWAMVALVAAWGYRYHAIRRDRPVLRLEHIARQPYAGLGAGIGLLLSGAIGLNAYLPVYIQGARGAGPGLTAWSVLFFTLGWTVGSNISGRLSDHLPESTIAVGGFFATVPSLAALSAAVFWSAPLELVFGLFFVAGLGVGATTNAGLTLLRSVTPPGQIGRAAAAHQFARSQGLTFGTALGGAVILVVVAAEVGSVGPVRELLAGETSELSSVVAEALESGYGLAGVVSAVLAGLGLLPMLSLRRHLAPARAARRRPGH